MEEERTRQVLPCGTQALSACRDVKSAERCHALRKSQHEQRGHLHLVAVVKRGNEKLPRCWQANGQHAQISYEYSDDWQDNLLGGKTIELGEISCLNVILAGVDPVVANEKGLVKNAYDLPPPVPARLEELRRGGQLCGDIVLYNGDGDFYLQTWLKYTESPEEFDGIFLVCSSLPLPEVLCKGVVFLDASLV